MEQVSESVAQIATKKRPTLHRSREVIARKIIAFKELTHLKKAQSERSAATLLEVPYSTMQSWNLEAQQECNVFSNPSGIILLQRVVLAAHFVISYGKTGIRGMQEFLQLSGLDKFVAASNGTLQTFSHLFEQQIVMFGEQTRQNLSAGMQRRKIAVALDETFPAYRICLVAIEVVSNYIIVEKYVENRTASQWKQAMTEGLEGLNAEIVQSPSDEGTAVCAYVKNELGAHHSPDLFHVQQELSRATSCPLKSKEKQAEQAIQTADKQLKLALREHGLHSTKVKQAKEERSSCVFRLAIRKKCRENVRAAIKGLGRSYHPINLKTGYLQKPSEIQEQMEAHMDAIGRQAQEAQLSKSCLDRIAKAKRCIKDMISYVAFFFMMSAQFINDLRLSPELEEFFRNIIFTCAYLQLVAKKVSKAERKNLEVLIKDLETKIREGPPKGWTEEVKSDLLKKGRECAELFQRSSSCVEGRNGVLSLRHHCFHRLSERKLKALTIVHNFHILRRDGTTAAERFFGQKHGRLFDWLVERMRIPGRPRCQVAGKGALLAA